MGFEGTKEQRNEGTKESLRAALKRRDAIRNTRTERKHTFLTRKKIGKVTKDLSKHNQVILWRFVQEILWRFVGFARANCEHIFDLIVHQRRRTLLSRLTELQMDEWDSSSFPFYEHSLGSKAWFRALLSVAFVAKRRTVSAWWKRGARELTRETSCKASMPPTWGHINENHGVIAVMIKV